MTRKKPLELGTTIQQQTVRRYQNYDLVDRTWADGDNGTISTREYHTKSGEHIDTQHRPGRKPGLVRFLDKNNIQPEKANSNHSNCSVGRSEDGTWYGWSHRAICGFTPGKDHQFSTRGADAGKPFKHTTDKKIKTEREARQSAKKFARSVS